MNFMTEAWLHQKSPEELTALLYEALERNLLEAKTAVHDQAYMDANAKLQKANDIIHRLGAGLNFEAGIIADQLEALYNYMAEQVIMANRTKTTAPIDEVLRILNDIDTAWQTAQQTKKDQASAGRKMQANAYEKQMMFD
ncbi:flagellar protein FliS [Salsuginibacillus halophilus]|uniref:Flagellar secretion chaperone FliS n=1 Tax=Salsuginibacillus halophilus TaxID=517424 RepID=A0A2P8HY09_9BACI|nr:flagellar export chaperone FliS [Salsuginibacillus halophilus]PSL51122.1 flagellar protein FliS [Salsuginibacillus halophilus]